MSVIVRINGKSVRDGIEFYFGYDMENILQVQDYVELNYSKDDYRMSKGYGDDVINFLKIYNVEKYDNDEELKELIECCEGEGCFYE